MKPFAVRAGRWPLFVFALSYLAAGPSCSNKRKEKKTPVSASKLVEQGKKSFGAGDVDGALRAYRAAAKARPRWAEAHNYLGMALRYKYYETSDSSFREEELAAFRRAAELNPKWVVPVVNRAETLWQMGRLNESANLMRKVLDMEPNHPDRGAMERRIKKAAGFEEAAAATP